MLTEINKVVITGESAVDFECITDLPMPRAEIKRECEEYIDNMQSGGRLLWQYYFRCKYLLEETNQMLMLFFYKGEKFGKMQTWKLQGVCLAEDWTEELEESGQIRAWLKTSINPEYKTDWVVNLRENLQKQAAERIDTYTLSDELPKEIRNAIYRGASATTVEGLSGMHRENEESYRHHGDGTANRITREKHSRIG